MTTDQFRRMTPAEYFAIARGKIAEVKRTRNDLDALNAVRCMVAAQCAGNKDAKMVNFMIFRELIEKKALPESELERKLMMIGGSSNG